MGPSYPGWPAGQGCAPGQPVVSATFVTLCPPGFPGKALEIAQDERA